jgi:hypothetical protein
VRVENTTVPGLDSARFREAGQAFTKDGFGLEDQPLGAADGDIDQAAD